MATFGIKLFLDDAEVDCDLYTDVNVGVGPFSPLDMGTPHRASFTLIDQWDGTLAAGTEATIVMTGPDPTGTPPSGVYDAGSTWEYVLFSGTIASREGNGPRPKVRTKIATTWIGEDSNIFNRRTSVSAGNDNGTRGSIGAVATDLGLTTDGLDGWQTSSQLLQDLPAQTREQVGPLLQTICAGDGTWPTCEWDWDGSDPTFVWRPSYFDEWHGSDVVMDRAQLVSILHPWLLDWEDVGITFSEFIAHLRVNGENASAVEKSGSASAAATTPAGNRRKEITTFIENDTDCGRSANRLIKRIGTPTLQHVYDVRAYLDKFTADLTGEDLGGTPYTANQAKRVAWNWGIARPGDLIQWFDSTDNDWPAAAVAIEDELKTVVGEAQYGTTFTLVTGCTWTWHPYRGWTASKSGVPYGDDEE